MELGTLTPNHNFKRNIPTMKMTSEVLSCAKLLFSFFAGMLLGVPLTFILLPLLVQESQIPRSLPLPNRSSEHPWVSGVFWSEKAESLIPQGFTSADDARWRLLLNTTRVSRLQEGCGRMQNRLLTFETGAKACCRYRQSTDQIQGEVFSFYLGRLLGLRNLVPTALSRPETGSRQWSASAHQVRKARWSPDRPAVLTQFVERLNPADIPAPLRGVSSTGRRQIHPAEVPAGGSPAHIFRLAQWSDLIVFDYLTANLDRVVNNLHNEQWDAASMVRPAHNLAVTPSGLLVFLDNESGLVHGYRLLRDYGPMHEELLQGLCVFRQQTVQSLRALRERDLGDALFQAYAKGDPGMAEWLPLLPQSSIITLGQRIERVLKQVEDYKILYNSTQYQ